MVAGAEYAIYVENKGYDVLTGSWLQFESIFKQNFQNISPQIEKEFGIKIKVKN